MIVSILRITICGWIDIFSMLLLWLSDILKNNFRLCPVLCINIHKISRYIDECGCDTSRQCWNQNFASFRAVWFCRVFFIIKIRLAVLTGNLSYQELAWPVHWKKEGRRGVWFKSTYLMYLKSCTAKSNNVSYTLPGVPAQDNLKSIAWMGTVPYTGAIFSSFCDGIQEGRWRAGIARYCFNFEDKIYKNRKKETKKRCKRWILKNQKYSLVNLLNELKFDPEDFKN